MKKSLISLAALIFLSAPAFAQPGDHDHGGQQGGHAGGAPGGGGHEHGGGAPGGHGPEGHATAAAPERASGRADIPGGGDQGRSIAHTDRSNPRLSAPPGAMQQVQPQAQPDRGVTRRSPENKLNRANRPEDRAGFDRGNADHGNRDPRDNNNRPGFDRGDNRGAFDNHSRDNNGFNRPGNNRTDWHNRNGQRRDFGNLRNFHRNITASRRFRAPRYVRPSGYYYRQWAWGETLPSVFWSRDYWLTDYEEYGLPEAPEGTVWVRYGSDALLIDQDTGEVIETEYNIFY